MKNLTCFLLLLTISAFSRPASAQYTLGDHPRILINKAMLPELARRAYAGGMLSDDYTPLKKEADRIVAEETCHMLDDVWHRPMDMLAACLVYQVERERGDTTAYRYARAVKHIWQKWDAAHKYPDGMIFSNIGPGHFGVFAIAFDWIYDYLTPEERKTYGDKLGAWLYYFTNADSITLQWGDWLYNQTWGPEHLNTPNNMEGITPKLMVALALSGAGTMYDSGCKHFMDSWHQRIPADCMPLFDLMGGVWSESMGHGDYACVQTVPWAFESWRTATGMDWFQLGSKTTYLKNEMEWAVDLTVPFNNRTAYIDDNASPVTLQTTMYNVSAILGARYRDPVANWVASTWPRGIWPSQWFNCALFRFISYDQSVPAVTPGQAGWPLSRLFTGAGHVYMRSKWDDPNATWAFFGAGPQYAGHSRDDEGTFLIARKGWLVLRAGGQGHNDDDYYAGGSLPFNIVTVYDKNEQFRRTTSDTTAGGVNNENDGGMIRRTYTSRTATGGQRQERGHITGYHHDLRYTYAAADLRDAYRTSKLSEINRQYLYLRGDREFFVIFDRVESTSADFPKTWFLHMPTRPVLDGSEMVKVADHVMSFTGNSQATWLSDPAVPGQTVYSDGRARAFLKTLLPRDAVTTLRGGTGYDYWGNPHEPTAQYNHTGNKTGLPPVVPWRLEIEPPAAEKRDYFLNVIEVTDEGQSAMTPVEFIQGGNQQVGIRISPSGAQPIEVFFDSTGDVGGAVRFGSGALEDFSGAIDSLGQGGARHDVNGDGKVGIRDVFSLILALLSGSSDPAFDFNGDGRVSGSDAVALARYLRDTGGSDISPSLASKDVSGR